MHHGVTIRAAGVLISVADSAAAKTHKNGDLTQPLLAMMLSERIIALHYLTKSSVIAQRRRAGVDSWEQQNYDDDYLSAVNSGTNDSQHEDSHENVSYERVFTRPRTG